MEDFINQDLDPGGPGRAETPQPSWAWRKRRWLLTLSVLLVAGPLYLASFVKVDYYLLAPGEARGVAELIDVGEGTQVFQPNGRILFTTVSLASNVNVYDALRGWLDDDIDVVPEEDITGGQPKEKVREINFALMDDSKLVATRVALEHLGLRVPVEGKGALVVQVVVGSPADQPLDPEGAKKAVEEAKQAKEDGKQVGPVDIDKLLEPGDVIVSIDNQPVTLHDQAVTLVRQHKPDDVIQIGIRRKDQAGNYQDMVVPVTAGSSPEGQAMIGVQLRTHELTYKFPIDVKIDTGLVSGPSAGLAFTLAIIDELTEGELTGGRAVAVTGTIDGAHNVGAVGGVAQKAVTARRAGAEVFLVPSDEVEQARARAGSLEIVGVNTLEEAIEALQKLGGTGLALPQPPPPSS